MGPGEPIAVVGAGLMGHGIAQVFATRGHEVRLTDADARALRTAVGRMADNLRRMSVHGLVDEREIPGILERVRTVPTLAAACGGCAAVIEAVSEDVALKRRVFAELDRACGPETLLCTNTSVIRIADIAAEAAGRARILGTHWWNPPFLVPLVEVVRAPETSAEAVERAVALLRGAGKHPVRVNRDVPGFIGNRLQHALWREAFALVDDGVCDPATVDEVVREGFGLRLPALGPVANADLVGLDLTLAIHRYLLPHLNGSGEPSRTLRDRVAEGRLGFKTGGGFLTWSKEAGDAVSAELSEHLLRSLAARRSTAAAGDRPTGP